VIIFAEIAERFEAMVYQHHQGNLVWQIVMESIKAQEYFDLQAVKNLSEKYMKGKVNRFFADFYKHQELRQQVMEEENQDTELKYQSPARLERNKCFLWLSSGCSLQHRDPHCRLEGRYSLE